MKKKILFVLFLALLSGCKESNVENVPQETQNVKKEIQKEDNKALEPNLDYEKIKPNELGKIMVLMYHNIGEKESTWTRTPDNFKKDLFTLYEKGYRAIKLKDYAKGDIKTPAGYTPVVITFDDGNENNFRVFKENGKIKIDPNCAIGILESFKKEHPDFNTTATFFVNSSLFNQPEYIQYKLRFLIENGYDLGNHTLNHTDLSKVDTDIIQKSIGEEILLLKKYIKDYDIHTLALPFGGKPKTESYIYTIKGTYESISYENIAVLLVGWDPYKSPYHKDFDFSKIHRVRASETSVDGVGIYDWIKKFDEGKEIKYVSDGDPNTIVIPKSYKNVLNEDIESKTIRTY